MNREIIDSAYEVADNAIAALIHKSVDNSTNLLLSLVKYNSLKGDLMSEEHRIQEEDLPF